MLHGYDTQAQLLKYWSNYTMVSNLKPNVSNKFVQH